MAAARRGFAVMPPRLFLLCASYNCSCFVLLQRHQVIDTYIYRTYIDTVYRTTHPCLFLFRLERQQRTMRVTTTPTLEWKMEQVKEEQMKRELNDVKITRRERPRPTVRKIIPPTPLILVSPALYFQLQLLHHSSSPLHLLKRAKISTTTVHRVKLNFHFISLLALSSLFFNWHWAHSWNTQSR